MNDKLARAALAYATRYNWRVFPLVPRQKKPMIENWQNIATVDPKQIRAWWAKWPDANIGLACGPSGVVVIDLDIKSGHDGPATWAALKSEHGIDDNGALVSITGGGGQQLFFAANGHGVGTNTGRLGDGVDVRANGGLVVLPPSIHPNGAPYVWESSAHPEDHPLAAIPDNLAALLTSSERPQAAPPLPEIITAGQRNATLASVAGSMRRRGASSDAILAALRVENADRCQPPLEDAELAQIAESIGRYAPTLPGALGRRVTAEQAETIAQTAPESPDPEFTRTIAQTLAASEERLDKLSRRKTAAGLLLSWLNRNGGFVQSETAQRYYYYRAGRRLMALESEQFAAFLFTLSGLFPSSIDYTCMMDTCRAAGLNAPVRAVVKVAAWDKTSQTLRVSKFDGAVFVLDGETITSEVNGENVIFDDDPGWRPYDPDFTTAGALEWSTANLPNWEGEPAQHGLAFRAWLMASFFSEICPARPLLVLIGEKGSGKSVSLRVLLRLMFGPTAELSGVPDKPDGFTVAAAGAHLLVLDNLDDFTGWLRDKLARISTGAQDEMRRLYTTHEVQRVKYRCWLAMTARTPDTLRRDDLADRLLLLPVTRIGDAGRLRETDLFDQAEAARNNWWGDVLTTLNRMVAEIRAGGLYGPSSLRMADFEALARVLAKTENKDGVWTAFVDGLKRGQADFLLDGDLIVDGLETWLENPLNRGRAVTARELHAELTVVLFQDTRPPRDWPSSVKSFGKRLATMRRELQAFFAVEWSNTRGRICYRFNLLESQELTV